MHVIQPHQQTSDGMGAPILQILRTDQEFFPSSVFFLSPRRKSDSGRGSQKNKDIETGHRSNVKGEEVYLCADPNESNLNQTLGNEPLSKVYKTIEASFREAHDRWGENEAWYLGVVAGRKNEGRLKRIMSLIFLDIPSRHGIDLIRVILVSAGFVFLFSMIYWPYFHMQFRHQQLRVIAPAPSPDQRYALRFRPFERYLASRNAKGRQLRPFRDGLSLSGRAFHTPSLGTSVIRVAVC